MKLIKKNVFSLLVDRKHKASKTFMGVKKMAKESVYEIITNKIIESLENGVVPWRKPWNGCGPRNYKSNRIYNGINYFLLSMSSYNSPYWLTFKQAQELGGSVKKGEKGSIITFWKINKYNKIGIDGKKEEKTIPMLRYYRVFNLEQCENVREIKGRFADKREFNAIEAAEAIIGNMPNKPIIGHGGNRAFYTPALDSVMLPEKENFKTDEGYYSTAFHELAHATGHESRLNRFSEQEKRRFSAMKHMREKN